MGETITLCTTRKPPLYKSTHCKVSLKQLTQRCHTLRITTEELLACDCIAEVQAMAKQQYRILAKQYHPDTPRAQHAMPHGGRALTPRKNGYSFRRITSAYHWICALPGEQLIDLYYWTPIPEAVLPWAMERAPLALGPGWQEWFL